MKKMTKTLVLISAAAVMALSGCGRDRVPAGVMDEEQMVDFLSEAYLLESFYAVETDFNYSRMSGRTTPTNTRKSTKKLSSGLTSRWMR